MGKTVVYDAASKVGAKLYDHLDCYYSSEMMRSDIENDYLTLNEGRDGNEYLVYVDENRCAAIRLSDEVIIEDDQCEVLSF
jgi:hypothetical protein